MFFFFVLIARLFLFKRFRADSKSVSKVVCEVRFHAPKFYNDKINFNLLEKNHFDKTPIYKITTPLKIKDFFILKDAYNKIKFSPVLILENEKQFKRQVLIARILFKDMKVYFEKKLNINLALEINKLNINFSLNINYIIKEIKSEIKLQGEIITEKVEEFYFIRKYEDANLVITDKEFVLNGKNHCINFINKASEPKTGFIEIKLPIKRGYYFFKNESKKITAKNIITGETFYFVFNLKPDVINHSLIAGLENSTEAGFFVKFNIKLNAHEEKQLYIKFGSEDSCVSMLPKWFYAGKDFYNNMFPVKIFCHDKFIEDEINLKLPRRIILCILNGEDYTEPFQKYQSLINQIFIESKLGLTFIVAGIFKDKNIEIIYYHDFKFYKIKVDFRTEKKLLADGVAYGGLSYLSFKLLKQSKKIEIAM